MARPRRIAPSTNGIANADGNAIGPDSGDGNASGGDDSGGIITIDPTDYSGGTGDNAAAGGSAAGDAPKRRGRKPGTGTGTRSKNAALDVNGVEMILLSTHTMLAAMTNTPEFALDKVEANTLALGINNVARHYNVSVAAKTLDWVNLFTALGMVYGPRLVAIRMNAKAARKEKRQAEPANDAQFIFDPTGGAFPT